MSGNKFDLQERFDRLEPSPALLRRTEKMMARVHEKKNPAKKAVLAFTAVFAVLCLIVGGLILARTSAPDNVQPLANSPVLPKSTNAPGGRNTAPTAEPTAQPEGEPQEEKTAGVTLTVTDFGAEGDSVFAEWTVRSELDRPVYYTLEYEIVTTADVTENYMANGGASRSVSAYQSTEGALLFDVPVLQELTPEKNESSGSLSQSYSTKLPEGDYDIVFTLHVFEPVSPIADWGDQSGESLLEQTYKPQGRFNGDLYIYTAGRDRFRNSIPAYQQALVELQEQREPDADMYLEALTLSGLFTKLPEHEQVLRAGEIVYTNKTELSGMVYDLPNRTVQVDSFVVTQDTLEMRYQVFMKDMAFTQQDEGRTENTFFYVLDDEGGYIASAADGTTIDAGYSSVQPYAAADGSQAYDCWLRFDISLRAMPEYFVFAPHRQQSLRYAGERAERFEQLYRLTAPEECFAISLGGEVVDLKTDVQVENGLSFTLTKTDCASGVIDIEWAVQSSLEEDIYYFVDCEFIPAESGWELYESDGSHSTDSYAGMALFDAPGQLLTAQEPAFTGRRLIHFMTETPCPGGEMELRLYAFRAADGVSTQDEQVRETLMDLCNQSSDAESYAQLITESGLFEEAATLMRSFSVPAYKEASAVRLENIAFSYRGRDVLIESLFIGPTGINMEYAITNEDPADYQGENEYEGMYYVVTAYGSEVGLGYKYDARDGGRCGYVTETEWSLDKTPEYIVLVPYGKMSADGFMELREMRFRGGIAEKLRDMYYKETAAEDCIRIYMDGRVTTNELNDQQVIPTSTMSEPSTLSEPIENPLAQYCAVYETSERSVWIRKRDITADRQYVSYSYPVSADAYEAYLDPDNYDGLYFAAFFWAEDVQFFNGTKGIETLNGERYWLGVIMGDLHLEAVPDKILLVPYPAGFTYDDLVSAKIEGKTNEMLQSFYEQADPDACIPLYTNAPAVQAASEAENDEAEEDGPSGGTASSEKKPVQSTKSEPVQSTLTEPTPPGDARPSTPTETK